MRTLYIISITFTFLSLQVRGQDTFDPTQMIDWGDPIYANFFTNTCPTKKSATVTTSVVLNKIYNTNDASWADETYCYDNSGYVIGGTNGRGCNLTCMAMILANGANLDVDPLKLENFLKGLKDDTAPDDYSKNGFSSSCCVSYFACETYTGNNNIVKYDKCIKGGNDPFAILRTTILKKGYAMARITYKSITCGHWILVYGYDAPGTSASDFYVINPDGGLQKKLSDYYGDICTDAEKPAFHLFSVNAPKTASTTTINNSTTYDINTKSITIKIGDKILFISQPDNKKSATIYCNTLWVLRDNYGNFLEKSTNSTFEPDISKMNTPGTYTVSLAIEDDNGFDAEVKTIIVEDESGPDPNPGSNLDFTFEPFNSVTGEYVTFEIQNKPFGFITWSFGDGSGIDGKWEYSPEPMLHPFSQPGNYTVTCTVGEHLPVSHTVPVIQNTPHSIDDIAFRYLGYHWYATAMNTNYNIQDFSSPSSNVNYISVCWQDNVSHCIHYACNMETWAAPDHPTLYCHSDPYPFKIWVGNRILSHVYTTEGHKSVRYTSRYYFNGSEIEEYEDFWGGANIVDCNKTRTSTDVQNSVNSNWEGWAHAYFSGSFKLTGLSNITNYNKMKLILSACNSIELDPNTILDPTGTGNFIQLEVGVIEGSQGGGSKVAFIADTVTITKPLEIIKKDEGISIFPNPNNGSFTVSLTNEIINGILVVNIFGQSMQFTTNNYLGNSFNISLSGKCKGMYLVRLRGRQRTYIQKIVVE